MFSCSLDLCQALLRDDNFVLNRLGREFAYEVCVGHNGRVHVNAVSPERTIVAAQAIQHSQFLSDEHLDAIVSALMLKLKNDSS